MKKFEYKQVGIGTLSEKDSSGLDMEKLNELGKDGWELVAIMSEFCIFERECKRREVRPL